MAAIEGETCPEVAGGASFFGLEVALPFALPLVELWTTGSKYWALMSSSYSKKTQGEPTMI